MSKEVPEHWARAMERKGFTHRNRPSVSRLAGETSLATETVRRMVFGLGTPEQVNVNEVADALGVSRIKLNEWIGIARSVEESYEPPADADLMDQEQRKAVDRVIQLFVDDKRAGGYGAQAAANIQPDSGPGLTVVPPPGDPDPYGEALEDLPDEQTEKPPMRGRTTKRAARKVVDKKQSD